MRMCTDDFFQAHDYRNNREFFDCEVVSEEDYKEGLEVIESYLSDTFDKDQFEYYLKNYSEMFLDDIFIVISNAYWFREDICNEYIVSAVEGYSGKREEDRILII